MGDLPLCLLPTPSLSHQELAPGTHWFGLSCFSTYSVLGEHQQPSNILKAFSIAKSKGQLWGFNLYVFTAYPGHFWSTRVAIASVLHGAHLTRSYATILSSILPLLAVFSLAHFTHLMMPIQKHRSMAFKTSCPPRISSAFLLDTVDRQLICHFCLKYLQEQMLPTSDSPVLSLRWAPITSLSWIKWIYVIYSEKSNP